MKTCEHCGSQNNDDVLFCNHCGKPFPEQENNKENGNSEKQHQSLIDRINNYMGNTKKADLNWKVMFVHLFKKHSRDDAEAIFICGTKNTTPPLDQVEKSWPRPWLYARVFLMFLVAFVLLFICSRAFENVNTLPGLIVVGSFMVPLTAMVLFLEMNPFRNISFYRIANTFLIGVCASIVLTFVLFSILEIKERYYVVVIMVGIIEEIVKAIIVFFFIKRLGKVNILPGMLIGAAVGAGFAAFESAGYAMQALFGTFDDMMHTIILRGVFTPGGHVTWTAISGAAIAFASKETGGVKTNTLINIKFLRLFAIPVALHALWDSPLSEVASKIFLIPIILTVVVWIVVIILFNMGLAEIPSSKDSNTNTQQIAQDVEQ